MAPAADDLRDSFRGALLGAFVGEALGTLTKGWGPASFKRDRAGVAARLASGTVPGRCGGDTRLMIALAEWLLEEPERDLGRLAARLVDAYDPDRGYGRGTTDVIRRLRKGEAWDTAGLSTYPRGSFGNGAAARIAPCALVLFKDAPARRHLVEEVAALTHPHPLGVEGAALQAEQLALAIARRGGTVEPQAFANELRSRAVSVEFRLKLQSVEECLDRPPDDTAVRDRLGCNETALGSVATALYCFLSRPESFAEAVAAAILLGGDAGSLAAMTGAIAGAWHGAGAIPRRWREQLEEGAKGAAYVEGLADRLVERAAAPAVPAPRSERRSRA